MPPVFSMDRFRIRKLRRQLKEINSLAEPMRQLTDQQLQAKTDEFKQRLKAGEMLSDLLPEAYAVVREVNYRLLGLFAYDVQVMGAIVLHEGNVAEMKTGEGKTLTATMPLYLNALTGKGVMLITPSTYLALRDCQELAPVYRFLGLTVSVGVFENDKKKIKPEEKRRIYASDIVYTTNSALGFDYLIHHLATEASNQYMRPFHYAILDEVDAVLMDMAQTPLVISGSPRVQSNLYAIADKFVTTLTRDDSYYFDEERNEVWLTKKGIDEAERYFNVAQLYLDKHSELTRHLTLSLNVHKTMESGKDYLVEDGEVKLLDKSNGRVLEGTKLQGGFHQALEEKEQVELTQETRAMASITYQNLFLMFEKLAGMTGTGKTVEEEFIETYNMEVVQIPTNRPVQRIDYPDKIYTTLPEKIVSSIEYLKAVHATGRPVLLVTGSVRMSELYSEILLLEGIAHNLLNAFNAAKEAQMIAEAGQLGAVTVATTMAGRGTDIKLAAGVEELGGLAIIGTERMINKRMDLQVRGRSGRQGNPGSSQFFVSLEDDLVIEFGDKWLSNYFKKHKEHVFQDQPKALTASKFRRALDRAQEASENRGRQSRLMTLRFDDSVKIQRQLVYKERDQIIAGDSISSIQLHQLLSKCVDDFLEVHPTLEEYAIQRFILDNIDYRYKIPSSLPTQQEQADRYLKQLIFESITYKKLQFKNEEDFQIFSRMAILKAIDEAWIENIDYLQQLRILISGRQAAQRNPVFEYHREALRSFEKMKKDIRSRALQYVMLGEITYTKNGELEIYFA